MSPTFPTMAEEGSAWLEVLASLAQHRTLTAAQVRAMHLPAVGIRRAQQLLADLGSEGLADRASGLRAQRIWFATARGVEVVRSAGAFEAEPPILDRHSAAGRLMAHTLAVNDVGVAFMATARERGEDVVARGQHPPFDVGAAFAQPALQRGTLLDRDVAILTAVDDEQRARAGRHPISREARFDAADVGVVAHPSPVARHQTFQTLPWRLEMEIRRADRPSRPV